MSGKWRISFASAAAASEPATALAAEVDPAYAQYEAIKAALPALTVDELRARFAAVSAFAKPVLSGVLSKLGYPAGGSKESIEAQLLDNLTSIKISLDQTKRIGS